MARAGILAFLFLILSVVNATDSVEKKEEGGILSVLEDKLEIKFGEYTNYITQWLAKFNDKRLGGNSELGRFLHYDEIKPKMEEAGKQARGMKKMSMAMIPLIFHVGATSTWMLLTMFLAAKSVAIGMILLIFKIAVSSAKVASFFTILKGKHLLSHAHHGYHEWAPHYEHHGHRRSLDSMAHIPTYLEQTPTHEDYTPTHTAAWSANDPQYKTLATYKQSSDPYAEYAAESKQVNKVEKKNFG